MARYDIRQVGPDSFDLHEDGSLLCSFTRSTFRESLTALGRSSNWIGCIYPSSIKQKISPALSCLF
jgi:hypothetical protein